MKLVLASISKAKGGAKNDNAGRLVNEYISRASRMVASGTAVFGLEEALLGAIKRQSGRVPPTLVLFDSGGESLTSESLSRFLGELRDGGAQQVFLCVGPADGWSKEALARADRVISLGRMTLPHDLARVVVAEQIYRALTILAGHPYHCGH